MFGLGLLLGCGCCLHVLLGFCSAPFWVISGGLFGGLLISLVGCRRCGLPVVVRWVCVCFSVWFVGLGFDVYVVLRAIVGFWVEACLVDAIYLSGWVSWWVV